MIISKNLKAFLDTLAWSEGTSTSTATRARGYDVIVTGADGKPEIFKDFSAHPFAGGRAPKVINSKGLASTASGRYQFLVTNWAHYRAQLGLADFGTDSQDIWAIQLLRERHALPLIEAGKFAEAVAAVCPLWASLPGAGYPGQKMRPLAQLAGIYAAAGGTFA